MEHPDDEDAFQDYLAIVRAKLGAIVVSTDEQLEAELKKRLASLAILGNNFRFLLS